MNTPEQCCFAAAAESPVPRCEKPATRKWGGIWFCDEHGSRSMPVAPAVKPAGPEWVEKEHDLPDWVDVTILVLKTPLLELQIAGNADGWLINHPGPEDEFPTLEAAQSAAIARAVELVEGTLAILKP